VNRVKVSAGQWNQNQNFQLGIASTATHELTHLIENEPTEHVTDGNGNQRDDEDADKAFLMYAPTNPLNFTSFRFDQWTRQHLNLTHRQSIEDTSI
jgi:hypothetical protein